jgi:hypothetical protein
MLLPPFLALLLLLLLLLLFVQLITLHNAPQVLVQQCSQPVCLCWRYKFAHCR